MARQDPTFSSQDLIRFYKRNLKPEEKAEVRKFFREEVFGGPSYHQRLVLRLVNRTMAYVSRNAGELNPFTQLRNSKNFFADLANEAGRLVQTELGGRRYEE